MSDTRDDQKPEAAGKAAGNSERKDNVDSPSAAPVRKPVWLHIFGHDITAPFLLLLLSLALFVPGQWTVPPLDRDEPRFTQATKQMLETNDYIDIRFQDQARHKKPVGIYWLQAAAVKLTGQGADAPLWAYRLPSVIASIISVLATFWLARAFMGPAGALLAAGFVALAIIVGVEARLAKTDAALFAMIIIAQGALARVWLKDPDKRLWGLGFLFWTALAGSVLIKGPVGPMVIGLTVVGLMAMKRKAAWFKGTAPIAGLLWFVLLVSPWFVAIWIATDGTFFTEAIGKDLLGKVGQGQEGHGAPPLTHLGAMFGIFWPLPAFFVIALPLIWHERKSPLVTFAVAWFVPSWIVFELVATKLPHYTMPLLPALALPVAAALMEGAGATTRTWLRWVAAVLLAVPALGLAVAAFAGPFALGVWPSPPGAVLLAVGAVFAIAAASRVLRGPALYAFPAICLTAICVSIGFWGFVGPALTPIWVSPRLVAAMDEIPGCADKSNRLVVTTGFHEPSFIFLEGTTTKIVSAQDAAAFLAADEAANPASCRIAAIESREEAAFLAAAKEIGLVPEAVKRVDGLNINGGDDVDIGLYEKSVPTTVSEDGNEQQQ
ncbi:Undecaprenyl phosphate-alpha-4-amino-4-deoxy-L-arabinose arabinosyl transferase [Labrenzia sp. THAF35]|uniref:ArnT family glycosyltransferase n=1 Tax=Stappiaceae TaxID=2821832 RepID=UPI001267D8F1|nr:glycosyltransferase family 39 protein [Labrenzia sp. THAF35]QFT69411.1 Undecaprenyl phosphate-alpha-4-amino-4-deoxy-L-arabinose arabinosyl transferase [Labrenzia sp. THAF35]